MITGARGARPSWFRRLVARVAARELAAFVVPGPEIARAHGLDVEAAGLQVVGSPRPASVLLVAGELPAGLKRAAAVAYAQMVRPRAVLAAGAGGEVSPLPEPAVSVTLDQEALIEGVEELRRAFADGAFDPDAADFEAEVVQTEEEGEDDAHQHGSEDHDAEGDQNGGTEGMDQDSEDGAEMDHGDVESMSMAKIEQGMPVSGEDFMSMVEMTQGMPVSGDGLIMEWFEAPYGPLFPGLPGGLYLSLTLDGDTVAQAQAQPGVEGWASAEDRTGAVRGFADHMSGLDLLSPVAYRLLACRAVEDATGTEVDEETALGRVGALERERAASHLGWLATFGYLIGDRWLSHRAGELQLALLRAEGTEEVERLRPGIKGFIRQAGWTPLLGSRLKGIGFLRTTEAAGALGPVARAGGFPNDARADEQAYQDFGFAPMVREGNDAFSRLWVRLEEIEQSLDLVRDAGSMSVSSLSTDAVLTGTGTATVETPRGTAMLEVALEGEEVSAAKLDAPSVGHLELVKSVAEGNEVADALVGVASLDLSPWEAS